MFQINRFIHPVRCVIFFTPPNCLTTNTLELLDIEDKKKGFARFMQIKRRDCEFNPLSASVTLI